MCICAYAFVCVSMYVPAKVWWGLRWVLRFRATFSGVEGDCEPQPHKESGNAQRHVCLSKLWGIS